MTQYTLFVQNEQVVQLAGAEHATTWCWWAPESKQQVTATHSLQNMTRIEHSKQTCYAVYLFLAWTRTDIVVRRTSSGLKETVGQSDATPTDVWPSKINIPVLQQACLKS